MSAPSVPAPVRRRMRGDDRRVQLLDEAARLVVESGAAAVTMERLAERAGVSKALPYRHFRDADDVLVALYRRETAALGRAVWERVSATPADGDRVGVGVGAYFDALAPRRDLLVALSSPASAVPAMADPDGAGTRFAVRLLRELHGVEPARAKAVAGMVQGAIVGAAGSYLAGVVPRATVEAALVRMIRAVLDP